MQSNSKTRNWLAALAVATAFGVVSVEGCSDGTGPIGLTTNATTSSTGGNGGMGGGGPMGEAMFRGFQDDLLDKCKGCHSAPGDTPFFGDTSPNSVDDPYVVMSSWPEFVIRDVESSRLLTRPKLNGHPKQLGELEAPIRAWLQEEAKTIGGPPTTTTGGTTVKIIEPQKLIIPGFNRFDLGQLGDDYIGMAVTFQADLLTDNTLYLVNMELHPTGEKGIKISHPFLLVYPVGNTEGILDPVDSFSNVTIELQPGEFSPIGPGTVILPIWEPASRIAIAFETIEVIDPLGGGGMGGGGGGGNGPGGACSAQAAYDLIADEFNPCEGCHSNGAAQGALDLSQNNNDTVASCGQVLNRVNTNDPALSQIFIVTNPNVNGSHPFKFGGSANNHSNFVSAVTQWIQQE